MFKAILSATLVSATALLVGADDASAEHRWRRFDPFPHFVRSFDPFDDDEIYRDFDDEEEIAVPRRNRKDWVYDPVTDEFVYRPRDKKKVAKAKPAKPAATARRATTAAEKRKVAAITGKPQVATKAAKPKSQKVAAVNPVAKPSTAEKATEAELTTPAASEPVVANAAKPDVQSKTSSKPLLVLPKEDQGATPIKPSTQAAAAKPVVPKASVQTATAPKGSRLTPITPAPGAISCDKAAGIVSGFGFTAVSPQLCVGKTYAFKAMRDGKQFEVRLSSASGELTEVRKL